MPRERRRARAAELPRGRRASRRARRRAAGRRSWWRQLVAQVARRLRISRSSASIPAHAAARLALRTARRLRAARGRAGEAARDGRSGPARAGSLGEPQHIPRARARARSARHPPRPAWRILARAMRLSLQAQYAICGSLRPRVQRRRRAGPGARDRRAPAHPGALSRADLPAPAPREARARASAGPAGGYTLARPASEITLRDVVEAVEGPLDRLVAGALPGDAPARPGFLWPQLAEGLGAALAGVDFETLCARGVAARGAACPARRSPMYSHLTRGFPLAGAAFRADRELVA